MLKPSRDVVPVIGFGATASRPSHELLEARQESQILTAYALNHYLRDNSFKVTVCRGNATLSGSVAEDVNRELAIEIARGVAGIKSVDSQIEVNSAFSAPEKTAERSFGEIVDDASITSLVKSKLSWSRHADDFAVKVETTRGKVTLTGDAQRAEAKDAAGMLAGNTLGVSEVDNQIMVEAPKPRAVTGEATDVADGWITAKVKATFMYSGNVNGLAIAISTQDGVVTLTGKLAGDAERALAIALAQNVRGVKSVDSNSLM